MSNKKRNRNTIIIFIMLLIIVGTLVIVNYGTIIKVFYPPEPVIVSHNASDLSSKLFEYSATIQAEIRNDGGDGYIVLEATVMQDGKKWTKTTKKYFGSKETARMQLQFDEIKLLGGKMQYSVRAYSYGK